LSGRPNIFEPEWEREFSFRMILSTEHQLEYFDGELDEEPA
jgi:hypothetical protein